MIDKPNICQKADSSAELNDALAALIASTKRVNRKLNLVEIANKIEIAKKHLGSTNAVADAIGLSNEMVRQFARANKVVPSVKKLITKGKISGVDVVDRISRLPPKDQYVVAVEVSKSHLLSDEIRGILALRKSMPRSSIKTLIKRIKKSKNIKEYIAQFIAPPGTHSEIKLLAKFARVFGRDHVKSVSIQDGLGEVVLDVDAMRKLQQKAESLQISKGRIIQIIIRGNVF